MSLDLRENKKDQQNNDDNNIRRPIKRFNSYGNVLVSGYGFKLGSGTGLFGKRNWKKRFFILPRPKGMLVTKILRLYYYLQAGDKQPRGLFELTPNSFAEKVDKHATAPNVPQGDAGSLYPLTIYQQSRKTASGKKESIDEIEARGKALRIYLFSEEDRESWIIGINKGIKYLNNEHSEDIDSGDDMDRSDVEIDADTFDEGDSNSKMNFKTRARSLSNTSNHNNVNVLHARRKSNLDSKSDKMYSNNNDRSNVNDKGGLSGRASKYKMQIQHSNKTTQSNNVKKPRVSFVGSLVNMTSKRFTEAARRGSTDGFDMSKASDRLCVNYLRQMQTLSTEKSSIDNVFHPLFVQHVCKILKVSTVSDKDMQRILYLEKAYLKKYTAFKSGRENVLTELRPRVEEFTNDLIAEMKQKRRSSKDAARRDKDGNNRNSHNNNNLVDSNSNLSIRRSFTSESEKSNRPVHGKIIVIVLKGTNLRKVTQFKKQDPYVKLQASGSRKAVATNFCKHGGCNPRWSINDSNRFTFPVSNYDSSLHIEAWASSAIKDTLIGENDVELSTFIDNPSTTEKRWVGLRTGNGDPAGRLLLTFKFIEFKIDPSSPNNRARNLSSDSVDGVSSAGNWGDDTYGNLFVGLPNMVVHDHVWGAQIVCQVRLEDVSAQTIPFEPNKEMAEDGKVSFIGWEQMQEEEESFLSINQVEDKIKNANTYGGGGVMNNKGISEASEENDENLNNNNNQKEEQVEKRDTNNILSLPVVNPSDIVVFEIFQYTGDRKALLGKAQISLMEILEVETLEFFVSNDQKQKKNGTNNLGSSIGQGKPLMPECCLQLSSEYNDNSFVGSLTINVMFVQDIWKIFSPRIVQPLSKPFELATFRENVARGNALIDIYDDCWRTYREFLDWKDPVLTGLLTTLFIPLCLYAFDRFLIIFPGFFVAFLIYRYRHRLDGSFAEIWHHDELRKKAKLKIACLEGSNMTPMNQNALNPNDLTSDPYIVINLGKGYEKDSIHIGRTNTEYLTLNPKWGMNEKSAGRSRLHIPGKSTVIEKWDEHDTSFVTFLKVEEIFTDQELVFEVYDENPISYGNTTHDFMGEVKIPMQDLIHDENDDENGNGRSSRGNSTVSNKSSVSTKSANDGEIIIDRWYELSPLHSTKRVWSRHLEKENRKRGSIGKIHLRLQLILPEEDDENSRNENNNGNKHDNASDGTTVSGPSSQKSGTANQLVSNYNLIAQYRKLREAAFSIQNKMGHMADRYERMKNVLLWVHPEKSRIILYLFAFATLMCILIPSRYVILFNGLVLVTEKFRKEGTMLKRLRHMLSTIPTDAELKRIYKSGKTPGQSGRYQTPGNMTRMINLHAKREGFLKTPGRSAFGRTIAKINLRYFVLRGDTCSLQWWLTKQQAHAGLAPRGELYLPANAIVAPLASNGNRKYDIEVRGYNAKVGLLPMILIPRNRADQLGWLKAIEAVIRESQRRTHWKKRKTSNSKKNNSSTESTRNRVRSESS